MSAASFFRFRVVPAVAAAGVVLSLVCVPALAQEGAAAGGPMGGRGQGGQFAGMQRVAGEVVSVSGATITLKTEDGSTVTVVTTDNTRLMKGRGNAVKVAELKPGDGITAAGNLDAPNKTLHAAIVFAVDAAQVKAMKDNLGKTYIAGRVTSIDLDNAKLTVERPDHVSQTIVLDDSTSFRRGRGGRGAGMGAGMGMGAGAGAPPADAGESITLADVKVGDQVTGQGELKSGAFVPKTLNVMTPGQGRRREGAPGAQGAPAGTPPATPPGGGPSGS
jgi:hypothetical protein